MAAWFGLLGWELKMSKKKLNGSMLKAGGAAVAVAGVLGVNARSAKAALMLYINGNYVTTDSGSGVFSYSSSSIPGFSSDFDFGFTDVTMTSSPYAYLQLQTLEITNNTSSAATLAIELVETTPFTFPGTPTSVLGFNSSAAGTLNPQTPTDSVTFESIATPYNSSPIPLSGSAIITAGTVNVPVSTTYFVPGASYLLESDMNVSLAAGETASINGSTNVFLPSSPVPEPASIALLATGAMACLGRRRRA
jgi:hypothetical protein